MQKMLRKLLSVAGYIGFFGGSFYILFLNLMCGFASSGIGTRWNMLKILLLPFIISAGLPGLKFMTIWFYDVTVVDVDDGIIRRPSADGSQVGS